jgi:hypothetical protein
MDAGVIEAPNEGRSEQNCVFSRRSLLLLELVLCLALPGSAWLRFEMPWPLHTGHLGGWHPAGPDVIGACKLGEVAGDWHTQCVLRLAGNSPSNGLSGPVATFFFFDLVLHNMERASGHPDIQVFPRALGARLTKLAHVQRHQMNMEDSKRDGNRWNGTVLDSEQCSGAGVRSCRTTNQLICTYLSYATG